MADQLEGPSLQGTGDEAPGDAVEGRSNPSPSGAPSRRGSRRPTRGSRTSTGCPRRCSRSSRLARRPFGAVRGLREPGCSRWGPSGAGGTDQRNPLRRGRWMRTRTRTTSAAWGTWRGDARWRKQLTHQGGMPRVPYRIGSEGGPVKELGGLFRPPWVETTHTGGPRRAGRPGTFVRAGHSFPTSFSITSRSFSKRKGFWRYADTREDSTALGKATSFAAALIMTTGIDR